MVEPHQMELADFDGDGDLDLLIATGFLGLPGLMLLTNDGTGRFTDATASLPPSQPQNVFVDDLDDDGDLDIGLEGTSLINDGSGSFTAVPATTGRILSVDFDEDGVRDDVTQSLSSITIAGRTQPWGQQAARHSAWSIDVDGDGDQDLVVGCEEGLVSSSFYRGHVGILYNLRRDMRYAALPRIGLLARLELRACGNGTAATQAHGFVATGRTPAPLTLPGLGDLRLDPAQAFYLGSAVIPDADTPGELAFAVPASPALVGAPISTQALFVPDGKPGASRLGAARTDVLFL